MKTHQIVCLFVILCHILTVTSTPRCIADENITINCGFSGNSKAIDECEWIGDIGSKFAPTEEPNHKSNTSTAETQGTSIAVPYITTRLSNWQFTYVFPVTPGPKFVRLYFTRLLTQVGLRTFSLSRWVRSPYLQTSVLPFLLIHRAKVIIFIKSFASMSIRVKN